MPARMQAMRPKRHEHCVAALVAVADNADQLRICKALRCMFMVLQGDLGDVHHPLWEEVRLDQAATLIPAEGRH